MQWLPFITERFMTIISVGDQLKNPMTSSGIEPEAFWLAAQCLHQLYYPALKMEQNQWK
jgi:hypothetical protein